MVYMYDHRTVDWTSLSRVKTEPGVNHNKSGVPAEQLTPPPESRHTPPASAPNISRHNSTALLGRPSMQPSLYSEQHGLLPSEDVEGFFNYLDRPQGCSTSSSVAAVAAAFSASHLQRESVMFQNTMPAGVHSSPPTYHPHDTASGSFLHHAAAAGTSPVYVPTTRAVLPAGMPYTPGMNGAQSAVPSAQAPNAAVWDNSGYTTASTHSSMSMSQRFPFPPTPSPPINSPTGRTDSAAGFGSPLSRPGISSYPMYGAADISAWNGFNQGMPMTQQSLRRPGEYGEYFFHYSFSLTVKQEVLNIRQSQHISQIKRFIESSQYSK